MTSTGWSGDNRITFWFDVISPYAWLAFDQLPRALKGLACEIVYQPVLFAGLLQKWGQKGPAEIAPKRLWTYRQVAWEAHVQGTLLQLPRPHPFNPLALQRLALACAEPGSTPTRAVIEHLMRHVWCREGADPNEPAALAALKAALAPVRDPGHDAVKAELRSATEAAVSRGLFGVPTMTWQDRVFWGLDALPMLRAAIEGDPWFDGPGWNDAAQQPPGVVREG